MDDGARRVKLRCPNGRVFGFAIDATGTFEARCTATRCRRVGHDTVHVFNLTNGAVVTDHAPTEGKGRVEAVPGNPPSGALTG